MLLSTLLFSLTALATPQAEQEELIDTLSRATDGYAVASASEEFADQRSAAAMQARIDIYDKKLEIKGGVHLRDWLYSGMVRATSVEETEVLADAAANKKLSPLLRLVALRSLRRSSAPVPIAELLKTKLERDAGELGRAWQYTCGTLLASDRLVSAKKLEQHQAKLRQMMLEAGMPYLGFRVLEPNAEECALFLQAAGQSANAADLAQLLYVLGTWAQPGHPAFDVYKELASSALNSESKAQRVAAIQTMLSASTFELVPHLIQALQGVNAEPPSRYGADYSAALRALTGQQFAADAKPWLAWWQRSGQEWLQNARSQGLIAPKRNDTGESNTDAHETVASYFGIQIDSQEVGFLIDGSGSMNNDFDSQRSCAQAAAEQLEHFLDSLPDKASLQLRVVTREIQSPFKKVVQASAKNRGKALRFVQRFDYGPASAMYDALVEAQTDHELDTLIFVSDGGGSWGSFAYQAHMLDGLQLAYERSGMRIHCVCVGKSSRHARFMESLAELTGGTMIRP